jgi:hypothetical protein
MAARAVARAREYFTVDIMVERTIDIYDRCGATGDSGT